LTLASLQVMVKPVGPRCNLACRYCYYRGKDWLLRASTARMTDGCLDALIRKTLGVQAELTVFCWQGGEPTLAGLPFYRRAIRLMREYGAAGQRISNVIQTNGLPVTREWARFFRRYRFLVGVSLDGPRDVHDRHRRGHRGGGSHRRAVRAATLLEGEGVTVNILSVVTRGSRSRPRYAYFRERGFRHLQFIPCLEHAEGKVHPFSIDAAGYGAFLCDLFDAWSAEYDRVSVRFFDSVLRTLVEGRGGMCAHAPRCPPYLLVEQDGQTYPCDFFVEPAWTLGNIRDREIPDLLVARERFAALKAHARRACGSCRWLRYCQSGCPRHVLPHGGRNQFCASYRRFFAHSLDRFREIAQEITVAQQA
jgi:uncharacterized protein